MASDLIHRRLRRTIGLLSLVLGAFVAAPVFAAPPAPEGPFYSRQWSFLIPFNTDPGGEKSINRVYLQCSENMGRSFREIGVGKPTDKSFNFTTDHDGWYYFVAQTLDTNGVYHPAKLDLNTPCLKVCVDRTPPRVNVYRAISSRDGNAAFEWDVSDDTSGIKNSSLTFDYLPPGGRDWLPLQTMQNSIGNHAWNAAAAGTYRVRMSVADNAGNTTTKEITLTPSGAAGGAGIGAAPVGMNNNTIPPPYTPTPADNNRGDVQLVNVRKFSLDYNIDDVGDSKVKEVEVYILRDGKWDKYPEAAPEKGPFTVSVDKDGRYGFTLIAKSGAGLSEPPPRLATDKPQFWVEVDSVPPVVELRSLEMGTGLYHGKLTIRWTAKDLHIAARPINLQYGPTPEGPWKPFATELFNDGVYVWDIVAYNADNGRDPDKKLPDLVYIRVEAVDQAGNSGFAVSTQAKPTDLKIPKARVIKAIGANAGPMNPTNPMSP